MFIQQRKDVSPRFPGSGHILKYMKILDISWYRKGSNTQITVVYSLSYYSVATCSEVYYSTSHKNKCVIWSLSRMSWNRIVWVTLTGKMFLSYDISIRVHDSFMTIFSGGNNIAYTILSCNSYQGTLLQRHMVAVSSLSCWNAASLFTALHMQIVSKSDRRFVLDLWRQASATIWSLAWIPISKSTLSAISSIHFRVMKLVTLMSLIQSSVYFLMWQRLKMTSWLFCFHLALLDYSQNGNIHSLLVHSDSQSCLPFSALFLTEAKFKLKKVI